MSVKVGMITLGCRVNQYESSAIAEKLKASGFEVAHSDSGCDYYVVNTCAVTAESERKSRQAVRRMARTGRVAVIGCASQLKPDIYNIENVFYVGGCRDKQACVDAIINDNGNARVSAVGPMHGAPYEEMSVSGDSGLFSDCRAFIKIEDGCNGKCAYCIIPACRGNVRSRPLGDIIRESERLVAAGYKEIIITGIEVGAYNKAPLSAVIDALSEVEGLKRVRFGSLSPLAVNESFLGSAARSANFMPHLHLSLQSCCDKILRSMRRPYTAKDIFEKVALIREYLPGCMLSADIISGFPGETEEDFAETERAVAALGLFHVHSFPYSEREGTPAAEMPGRVDPAVRYSRSAGLIAASAAVKKNILNGFTGKQLEVLVEKTARGKAKGHTREFLEAEFAQNGCAVGDIIAVTAAGNDGEIIKAIVQESKK
ncbi:MAG: tRNA (N(6)-L-threonylcarbamoyladenosine(37)-C(2))-methylthiotransferase MtaB [Clostridia bacterium]|nr:tRNA (N(6)-L-threonylcarbamoyladenosine(37)-C(2))-methylthiotransferase MtaB [Clostridia bacterium]